MFFVLTEDGSFYNHYLQVYCELKEFEYTWHYLKRMFS